MDWFDSWGLSLAVFVPVVGMALVLLVPRDEEGTIKWITLLTTLVTFAATIGVLARFDYDRTHELQFVVDEQWIDVIRSRFHVGIDGISLPLLALSAFISVLCVVYSWNHFPEPHNPKAFLALLLLLETGMNGTFVAQDLILFFIFFEIVLLPMFFMIGVWGGPNREYASIKFFLFTLFGSALMLLSFLALFFKVDVDSAQAGMQHSFDIVALSGAAGAGLVKSTQNLIFAGLFIGFAIKVPMFPFHTWLPDAHVEAPTPISMILAGVLLKLGAYGILRIMLPTFPVAAEYWSMWLVALGAIAIVYGAFVCIAQTDLKRLIAYSSVSHMGYVMLGVGAAASVLTPEGAQRMAETFNLSTEQVMDSAAMAINGATLQMFNHGIITGALFLLVGVIYERAHTRELVRFGGLGTLTPYFYGMMLTAGFASLGLPGLAGFWAELFTFRGAFALVPYWAAFGAIGMILTAVYILWRIIQNLFLGSYDPAKVHHWTTVEGVESEGPTDMVAFEKITLWPLIITMFVLGIYPTLVLVYFNGFAVNLLQYIQGLL